MLKKMKQWFASILCRQAEPSPAPSIPFQDLLQTWKPIPPEFRDALQVTMDDIVQRRSLAPPENDELQTEYFEAAEQMSARGVRPRLVSGKHAKNGWLKNQLKAVELAARVSYIRHFLSHPENANVSWTPTQRQEYFLNFSERHDDDEPLTTEELLEDASLTLEWSFRNLKDCGLVVTMQVVRPADAGVPNSSLVDSR